MRLPRGIWLVGLLAAVCAAAVGVHASSAAPTRGARVSTLSGTYSCAVRKQRFVDLSAGVTMQGQDGKQSGLLQLTTVTKTVTKNGATSTLTQVSVFAEKNGVRLDKSTCRHVTKQVALKPKGYGSSETATPTFRGFINERCQTASRVLVGINLQLTNGVPSHALMAIRNDDAKSKKITFYNWSPKKIVAYSGNACVDLN
jgi:hypothetical protein